MKEADAWTGAPLRLAPIARESLMGSQIFGRVFVTLALLGCVFYGYQYAMTQGVKTLIAAQPPHFRERLLHYGYIDPRLDRYILCCDDARFLNHSDDPNLESDFTRERHGVDIAIRDIAAGEEMTVDYARVEGRRPTAR